LDANVSQEIKIQIRTNYFEALGGWVGSLPGWVGAWGLAGALVFSE
jgi:hypothetical protein